MFTCLYLDTFVLAFSFFIPGSTAPEEATLGLHFEGTSTNLEEHSSVGQAHRHKAREHHLKLLQEHSVDQERSPPPETHPVSMRWGGGAPTTTRPQGAD